MIVDTVNELDYKGLGLNVGASGSRSYKEEYLSLIYDLVMDKKYLGYSVCHICITIDGDTPTNFYTRLFKSTFRGCVYILKREDSGGSFNDNAMGVTDSKGEHLHLFVFFLGSSVSVESFSKRLKDLISKVNKNKYRPRRIRNFNIVDSRVKDWVNPDYLEKYDVWFDSLDDRKRFEGSPKRVVVLKPGNLEKVFRWVSYLGKNETITSKTQKVLFVRDLTTS